MARPSKINLTSDEKKRVVSEYKSGRGARSIADSLGLPRYHVMALLESKGLAEFSEGSYN